MRPTGRTPAVYFSVITASCMILAACGSVPAARLPRRTAALASSPQPVVSVIRLYPSGFGLVGRATGPYGEGTAQLLETADFGASFHLISPPTAQGTVVDDAWALSKRLIWFDTFNTATTRERLYRTSNGGRSWASAAAPTHVQAAGSTDSIDFTTAADGWLVDQQPTGPGVVLYHSSDSGATWHVVAGGPPSPLRWVAPVEADPASGLWQAGGMVSDRLEHSTDGGRHWLALNLTDARPQAGLQPGFGLPRILSSLILAPVVVPHRAQQDLLVYASRTHGQSWVLVSHLHDIGPPVLLGNAAEPISAAFASPGTWWALDPGTRPRLFLTTDSGRHWTALHLKAGLSAWQVTAADARHGWALASTRHGPPYLLITTDGGCTWHPAKLTPNAGSRSPTPPLGLRAGSTAHG